MFIFVAMFDNTKVQIGYHSGTTTTSSSSYVCKIANSKVATPCWGKQKTYTVPAKYAAAKSVRLRFEAYCLGTSGAKDYWYIDNLSITKYVATKTL